MKTVLAKSSKKKAPAKSAAPRTRPTKPSPKPSAKPAAAPAPRPQPAARPATKAPARPAAALAKPPAAKPAAPAKPNGKAVAPRVAAHSTKAPATAKAAPKATPAKPAPAAPRSVVPPKAAPSPAAAAAAVADADKGRNGKKPKPPAKTMQVPAPVTDILVKREIPDVRRIASAALLSDTARGITPPAAHAKPKEAETDDDPPVDASLIASSLAADAHPKIEDNYDYSVLEELAASSWCPSPTRMVNTGCGGGEAAVYFAKRGFSVVGIDCDRTAVGLARERAWLAGVEIDFMVGDLFETPNLLPAESFGLAIDRGAFYKLSDDRDRQRYLANIRRLLFQGGVFYLSAGFFPLPEGADRPRAGGKKAAPKILLVREGGVVVNEIRQAGFEPAHRVLRPTNDSGEYGELFLFLKK